MKKLSRLLKEQMLKANACLHSFHPDNRLLLNSGTGEAKSKRPVLPNAALWLGAAQRL
jgi:hypothetical protein